MMQSVQSARAFPARDITALEAIRSVHLFALTNAATRAEELAQRFEQSLQMFRSTQPVKDKDHVTSLVSLALDRFIGEARTAVELAAVDSPTTGDVERLEQAIGSLNQMFVASEGALHVGTMAPASFMPGAQRVLMSAMSSVHGAIEAVKHRAAETAQETDAARARRLAEELRQSPDAPEADRMH